MFSNANVVVNEDFCQFNYYKTLFLGILIIKICLAHFYVEQVIHKNAKDKRDRCVCQIFICLEKNYDYHKKGVCNIPIISAQKCSLS